MSAIKGVKYKDHVRDSGNKICRWYNFVTQERPNDPWYKLEYKQGLRDALECMKRNHVIEDYDFINGVKMEGDN